jgi:hypothetical protein
VPARLRGRGRLHAAGRRRGQRLPRGAGRAVRGGLALLRPLASLDASQRRRRRRGRRGCLRRADFMIRTEAVTEIPLRFLLFTSSARGAVAGRRLALRLRRRRLRLLARLRVGGGRRRLRGVLGERASPPSFQREPPIANLRAASLQTAVSVGRIERWLPRARAQVGEHRAAVLLAMWAFGLYFPVATTSGVLMQPVRRPWRPVSAGRCDWDLPTYCVCSGSRKSEAPRPSRPGRRAAGRQHQADLGHHAQAGRDHAGGGQHLPLLLPAALRLHQPPGGGLPAARPQRLGPRLARRPRRPARRPGTYGAEIDCRD